MMNEHSESFKTFGRKATEDTRNNWVTMMFVTKCRFNCFLKQSHIDTCIAAFREFEASGFEFGTFGFGGNHVHFLVNIPKGYSVQNAEILLKSRSAKRMFETHPGFRKRYPRGSFWSGYEHHESSGRKDYDEAETYILDQQRHHNILVINDRQQNLTNFTAEQDTATPQQGLAE